MSSIKIKLIELVANMKDLEQVLMALVDTKGIHLVLSTDIVSKVHGFSSLGTDCPCISLLEDVDDIEKRYQLDISAQEIRLEKYNFNEMHDFIHDFKKKLLTQSNKLTDLKESIQKCKDALIQVDNIQSLDVALDDLFACEYVFFRFGRIPNDSLEKIKLFMNKPFVFRTFNHDKQKTWCMYYSTNDYKREVDNIFSSMLFERILIPDFIHGKPADAVEALLNENDNTQIMIDTYEKDMNQYIKDHKEKLNELKGKLLFLKRVYNTRKYVLGMGTKFIILGFVKSLEIDHFKEAFEHIPDLEIEVKEPNADGRLLPPKRIKENWFTF